MKFIAEDNPSEESLAAMAASAATNPFYTPALVRARRKVGLRPLILAIRRSGGDFVAACPAYVRSGRWSRSLEIESIPGLAEGGDVFWEGVLRLCRSARVSRLGLQSFASGPARIPALPGEVGRRERAEYLIDLDRDDFLGPMSDNHRRSVRKAEKAGVRARSSTDLAACPEHARLIAASLGRRRDREEATPALEQGSPTDYEPIFRAGAGRLHQTHAGESVLSSILVLIDGRGAYYHSAGTSPDGMACGASPFLVHEICRSIRDEGVAVFNLGGADPLNPGLRRFKADFGARVVPSEAAEFYLGGRVRKKLETAARMIRSRPGAFFSYLLGGREGYVLYAARPAAVPPPEPLNGVSLRKLTDEELAAMPADREELKEHAERLRAVGYNDAFAVYCEGQLAHISWLITPDHDRLNPVRNVKLREGEAEITHCVTLPEFRGRGLYPYAIRSLCRVAAEMKISMIYMITKTSNLPSRRGMEKAGLAGRGRVIRWAYPYLPGSCGLTYRSHRLGRIRRVGRRGTNGGESGS